MNGLSKFKNYQLPLLFIAIFVTLYAYWMPWETHTAYGDDLLLFQEVDRHHTAYGDDLLLFQEVDRFKFSDIIYHPLDVANGRAINRLVIYSMIALCKTNLHSYYVFNVFVQSLNTIILTLTVNLFLRSLLFSSLFSLTFGLSRFAFYNISQITFGGAMEGIGLTFFLLTLFYVVSAFLEEDNNANVQKKLLWGLLYANICVECTHPRYIVIFPFFLFVIVFFPFLKKLTGSQKVKLIFLTLGSIGLNVFIKKFIYHMPMLIGTGGSNFHFSFSTAFSFLIDGVLSIFQINSGESYLIGISFAGLPLFDKALAFFIVFFVVASIISYLYKGYYALGAYYIEKTTGTPIANRILRNREIAIFFHLSVLFFLPLLPAISTIRLEQRWLLASLSVFILMLAIGFKTISYQNKTMKYSLFLLLIFSFAWINFSYLNLGAKNTYIHDSEKIAHAIKSAMDSHIIHQKTDKLYFWEKKRDENSENATTWVLGSGYFFKFYGSKEKQLIFVDSIYTKTGSPYLSSFPGFDSSKSQIIYFWNGELKDITNEYFKDSLKVFEKSM